MSEQNQRWVRVNSSKQSLWPATIVNQRSNDMQLNNPFLAALIACLQEPWLRRQLMMERQVTNVLSGSAANGTRGVKLLYARPPFGPNSTGQSCMSYAICGGLNAPCDGQIFARRCGADSRQLTTDASKPLQLYLKNLTAFRTSRWPENPSSWVEPSWVEANCTRFYLALRHDHCITVALIKLKKKTVKSKERANLLFGVGSRTREVRQHQVKRSISEVGESTCPNAMTYGFDRHTRTMASNSHVLFCNSSDFCSFRAEANY